MYSRNMFPESYNHNSESLFLEDKNEKSLYTISYKQDISSINANLSELYLNFKKPSTGVDQWVDSVSFGSKKLKPK